MADVRPDPTRVPSRLRRRPDHKWLLRRVLRRQQGVASVARTASDVADLRIPRALHRDGDRIRVWPDIRTGTMARQWRLWR